MHAVPYYLMAAVHLVVFVGFVRLYIRDRSLWTLPMIVVSAGLVYDNFMIPFGATIGEGSLLENLSEPRFWIHGIFTPTLMLFGTAVARDMGVGWAQKRGWWIAIGTITAILSLRGFWTDVVHLEIEVSRADGFLRYTYVHPAHSLPPSIITVLVLLAIGVTIWRQAGWPWLFAGAAFMFLASGGGTNVPYVANIGEVALSVSLLASGWHAWYVRSGTKVGAVHRRAADDEPPQLTGQPGS